MQLRKRFSKIAALCAIVLTLGLLLPICLDAQMYFGQNQVRYQTFNWSILKTQHFDIHYYEEGQEAAEEAGRMAERWYLRLSKLLNHELPPNQPFILYASHTAFRGTTAIQGHIGEGTGGVTEALRRRIVMPVGATMAETDHVLGHELVHAFQFDMTTGGPNAGGMPAALRLPLWFVEGMAEYLTLGPADPHTAMWLRDAVRREDLPRVRDLDNPRYFPYRFGQAFWSYVAGRYGEEVIGPMLRAAPAGLGAAMQNILGISEEQFSQEWHDALNNQYEPVLQASEPPSQVGREVIGEQRGGTLNVSPAVSPDGRHMVFLSERDLFSIDLFLADAQTGRIIRKITETALDPHFDAIQFINSAGAWSADSRRFAYVSIAAGQPQLSIYDLERNRVTQRIRIRELAEIITPTWSPDGRSVAFSAISNGFPNLFVLDIETEQLRTLTNDHFAALQPSWSPDGRRIAFVTDRFTTQLDTLAYGDYRLALIDPATGAVQQVRGFPEGKHINPQWGAEPDMLYFISDRDGVSNIYSVRVPDGQIRQVTNIQTGITGISTLSPALSVAPQANRMVFSAFLGPRYVIYAIETPEAMAGQPVATRFQREVAGVLPPAKRPPSPVVAMKEQPQLGLEAIDTFTRTDYNARLGLDYIAPPAISVGMSNFGSMVGGGTALYFSDLLGHHNLMTSFQTASTMDGNFVNNLNVMAGYQNQKRRWTWGFIGGQIPFLMGGFESGVTTINGQTAFIERQVRFWQIEREAVGLLAYPFNRAQRIEFNAGFRNIGFAGDAHTVAYSATTGQLLAQGRENIPMPGSLNMGTASTALVYDTSIFGGTSPILGQRYRLEFGAVQGALGYTTALADYRRYFNMPGPLTLAGRIMHFGRYGGGAEDPRMQALFIAHPALVRGYDPNSFRVDECGPNFQQTGQCPAFDRLLGTRMGVLNAELRVPILGFLGVIPSPGIPPVEIAPFYDMGVTWTSAQGLKFTGQGPRTPVKSYGSTLRVNLMGFAVGQVSYVRPMDRPRGWIWEFALIPGF